MLSDENIKKLQSLLKKPTKEHHFICMDCEEERHKAYSVESEFSLHHGELGTRCIYCYNERTQYPINIGIYDLQYQNFVKYGVYTPQHQLGKTYQEIIDQNLF